MTPRRKVWICPVDDGEDETVEPAATRVGCYRAVIEELPDGGFRITDRLPDDSGDSDDLSPGED